ncbi:MAG TPA: MFS transporter [Bryobacteraceae bacterium]
MTTARVWLSGFLLLGVLLGLLGSLLVVWRYQIDVEPHLIGFHFLAVNAGYVIAAALAERLLRRISTRVLAMSACTTALASLAWLAFAAPPAGSHWRLAALLLMGLAAGALGSALLYGCEAAFEKNPLGSAFRAGTLFGAGCLLATVTIGATYFLGSPQIEMILLAVVPLVFLLLFAKTSVQSAASARTVEQDRLHETLRDLRSIATLLFSLLVFFQFGNEWAVAGWLPLFLIHRLGSNPALSIGVLAAYFVALMLGRIAAYKLLPHVHHRRFLIASITVAICGFTLLELAGSLLTATVSVVVIALGFAAIYPLISDWLDHRFSYHPGFYNGAISIAVTGAMSVPWLLGFVAAWFGMGYLMLLPALGSVLVLVLVLLLMFEAHLMRDTPAEKARSAGIS